MKKLFGSILILGCIALATYSFHIMRKATLARQAAAYKPQGVILRSHISRSNGLWIIRVVRMPDGKVVKLKTGPYQNAIDLAMASGAR